MDDEASLMTDHNEAWSLACTRQAASNLARCYTELRQLARAASDGPLSVAQTKLLRAIVTANDI